jgi:hypothetical protein
MEQKSEEWYQARRAKFTASEYHKLMTSGRTKDQLFGQVAIGYIMDVLDEIITSGDMNNYGSFAGNKATDWGEYWEPVARDKFVEKTGIKVEEVGFLQIDEYFGGSPDGVTEDAIIEIKCPMCSVNHTQNLFMSNQSDLLDLHKDYYIQMQVNMIAAKKDKGYFISYDPRKLQESFQLKIIEVKIDETMVEEIWMRYRESLKIISQKQELLYNML